MHEIPQMTRRRLFKTLFCSSMAMGLNLNSKASAADATSESPVLDLIAMGDFGSADPSQTNLAAGLVRYAKGLENPTQGMLLLGDNFYRPMPGGVKSPRWVSGFSAPYPASVFPGPCWAILGNHDYHDTPGNEQVQLKYAASLDRKTRWTMPGKFYRVDLPAKNPQVTFLMIDTNWPAINRDIHGTMTKCWMEPDEMKEQMEWLEKQLSSERAPFTAVVGHHPVYSDGPHGDTAPLVKELAPILQKHAVHIYLCGHDHDLQHLELEGQKTSFVISGGGGAPTHAAKPGRPGAVMNATHGFSHITLVKNRLHVRHLDVSGKTLHAFSKGVDHDWKLEA